MTDPLQPVLILLTTAVLAVVVFRSLRLPPMLGYLLAGVIIGPHALGLIADDAETRHLAEFGVVFLMFSIGLEFSLPKLIAMKRLVFGFGTLQVFCSILIVMGVAWFIDLNWSIGFVLGGALAMSSTAIVIKLLAERLELNSEHGRQIIGVLLFQDLMVIPLLIIVPALGSGFDFESETDDLIITLAKIAVVLVIILFLGQKLMRPWLHIVAQQRSSELFVLNVLLITLGLAWITQISGLSLALGAFLAGMLISETEYRYQVEEDIKPFRDVLLGLFFVTIGMLLDVQVVIENFLWVFLILVTIVIFKTGVIIGLSRLFGANLSVAFRTGMSLAQAGEFGFVLLAQASTLGVIDNTVLQPVLAAMVLSLFIAPFLIEYSEVIIRRSYNSDWMQKAMQITSIAAQTMSQKDHVIICGYGRSGQSVAKVLELESVNFIALDLDPKRINEARTAGESVVYGDAAKREVLIAAGLMRAKVLVVSYHNIASTLKILKHVQELRPELSVVAKVHDESDVDILKKAGVTEVVAEIMEGSLMLASQALMFVNVSTGRILRRIRSIREQRYNLLRGFYHGVSDETDETNENLFPHLHLHTITILPGAAAINKTLSEINLDTLTVEVIAVRKRNIRGLLPSIETKLEAGDVIVLKGTQENLAAAEIKLIQG
ncbi:MAG TPA: monovalent cation:proton antiporter-2 (CPA2) family protein [Nitrosomonas sp.]|nr:monovalent cation:proton antiporter-2 (CPA2) family protein [Nitrosomonas sp.]HQX13922.1 monovalent cation:proton antiporter-2 (CPA2) family protein [Nitrosomonas sp.]HRB20265.1 monovalent cation:proton antiporter-2 (CPA2) family protein [Nitrosomonas sp.]HRB33871.1 monovalent cation:proton antiporter-2 (CPA2) family protein [Nitrosomonas sp.]HRB46762.1 monovalent cation:proton antiporter-2 (CPA2) family protein [Nitrosomonas sp.]